jgi:hypothetical protein
VRGRRQQLAEGAAEALEPHDRQRVTAFTDVVPGKSMDRRC